MKRYKILWYNLDSLVKEESELIEANSEDDAIKKIYTRYGGKDNAPAECVSAILVE